MSPCGKFPTYPENDWFSRNYNQIINKFLLQSRNSRDSASNVC